jgi:predicted nucleic acid-binding protein
MERIEGPIFFFDTYAFFEVIRGNPKYSQYRDVIAITTVFNLAELNYGLKKETDEKTADEITQEYEPLLVEVTLDDVKKAMTLRRRHKDLSIPDAIGYVVAMRYSSKFLTGDDDFKDFPNVEFVKK